MVSRRIYSILLCGFIVFGNLSNDKANSIESIQDVSQLDVGQVYKVYSPHSVKELQQIVKHSSCPISIAGGRFSQGGHIWSDKGITIDMRNFNHITNLDLKRKTITVEAGSTWYEIQKYIDLYNLSIRVMQSYNDFTVGGSLSVNAHGRTLSYGALIETIESIKIMLANGSIVTANRNKNYDLFTAAIGGYGAIGIITEATLFLTDNDIIEQQEVTMPLEYYPLYFEKMIKKDPRVVFHNANLCINRFDTLSSVTWYKSNQPCTIKERFQANKFFSLEYFGFQIARYIKAMQKIRMPLHAINNIPKVVRRNYEMSASVSTVEPFSRCISTTVLQEYFIPCDKLGIFVQQLHALIQKYAIIMMNVSIRYVHHDNQSIMAYAQPKESFALVCYINMQNNSKGIRKAELWTRELINSAISCDGTYYLPYQLHATKNQFKLVYPRYKELLTIKNKVDPDRLFTNSFLNKYIVV